MPCAPCPPRAHLIPAGALRRRVVSGLCNLPGLGVVWRGSRARAEGLVLEAGASFSGCRGLASRRSCWGPCAARQGPQREQATSTLWGGRAQAGGEGVLGDQAMQSSIPGVAFTYPLPEAALPCSSMPPGQAPLLLLPCLLCQCGLLAGAPVPQHRLPKCPCGVAVGSPGREGSKREQGETRVFLFVSLGRHTSLAQHRLGYTGKWHTMWEKQPGYGYLQTRVPEKCVESGCRQH